MIPIILSAIFFNIPLYSKAINIMPETQIVAPIVTPTVKQATMPYDVPLYSQISDISSVEWKQKGCGVADVAMIVNFYKPKTTTVQKVLEQGIAIGAYQKNVGWKHNGLAALAKKYDMEGKVLDLSKPDKETAFEQFKDVIKEGPAIASIHRNFDPKLSFGHLIVITGFDDNLIYYNDPGKREGIRTVPITNFMKGWKRKLIVIRPPAVDPNKTETQIALAR
ncbi:C39 family peptidase [Patescibacteria group bacterium]|nr:C39 family peptidase [Patescibacteria group bacterium]MBU1727709.1 C39 family peptidase [Patescibacteria group bacterium]